MPRDLETVCLKCLHKEPHLRYASAAALAADLRRFVDGEAIAARPDGPLARFVRRVRRRPLQSALIAVGALCALALIGAGLRLISAQAKVEREIEAKRIEMERGAGEDLQEMARWLRKSSWPEARAALERAKGRLGAKDVLWGSAKLHGILNQGARDLKLVSRLAAIRMEIARGIQELGFARSDEQYGEAFREAEIASISDDPDVVAARIQKSNIQSALVAALDDWCGCTKNPTTKKWVAAVARKADPAPTEWRNRARSSMIQADRKVVLELLKTAPIADDCVPLFLALDRHLNENDKERLPFLKRLQQAHPGDYWVNQTLGEVLMRANKGEEAIRYYHSAISLRPRTALSHHMLGFALLSAGHKEEALRHVRLATDLEPTYLFSQRLLAYILSSLSQNDEAITRLRLAVRAHPNVAILRTELGHNLEVAGRYAEALVQLQQAVALDPKNLEVQREWRNFRTRQGQGDEARVDWLTALEAKPPLSADWHDYAEFCLFIGREDDYRRARQIVLAKFGARPTRMSRK